MPTPMPSSRPSPPASAPPCSATPPPRWPTLRWDRALVARYLGSRLSEPKADVFFTPPSAPLSQAAFAARARKRGLRLDRRTQWLYDDAAIYVNGEAAPWPVGERSALARLANTRELPAKQAAALSDGIIAFLYEGYRHGFLHVA